MSVRMYQMPKELNQTPMNFWNRKNTSFSRSSAHGSGPMQLATHKRNHYPNDLQEDHTIHVFRGSNNACGHVTTKDRRALQDDRPVVT